MCFCSQSFTWTFTQKVQNGVSAYLCALYVGGRLFLSRVTVKVFLSCPQPWRWPKITSHACEGDKTRKITGGSPTQHKVSFNWKIHLSFVQITCRTKAAMPSGYCRAKASVKRCAAKLFKVIVSSRQVTELLWWNVVSPQGDACHLLQSSPACNRQPVRPHKRLRWGRWTTGVTGLEKGKTETTTLWPLLAEMKPGLWEKAVRWAARPRDLQTVSADVIYWSQFQVLLWMEREKTSRMMRWSAGTCFALKRLDCFTCVSSTSPIQPWQLYGKIIGLLGHSFGQRCSSKCIQRSVL